MSSAFCEEVARNLNPTDVNYSNLASAVAKAATSSVLPKSERAKPGWFKANETEIIPLIQARNSAMAEIYSSSKRTRAKTLKLRSARKLLKRALSSAKNQWLLDQCNLMNNHFGTKGAWDTISKLKSGLSKTRPAAVKQMKKPEDTLRVRNPRRMQKSSERTFRNYMDGHRTMIQPL